MGSKARKPKHYDTTAGWQTIMPALAGAPERFVAPDDGIVYRMVRGNERPHATVQTKYGVLRLRRLDKGG